MEKVYRAALVGLGNISWRFDQGKSKDEALSHAGAYLNNGRTMLVGGCSPAERDRSAFEKALNAPTFPEIEEMIDRLRPDIVSICSPTELHYKHVLFCLEREISMIWLEKPPATSVAEIDALIEEQRIRGGRSAVLVNYQRRYTESYEKLVHLYREKVLGEVPLIQINYSRGLETNGSHMLDMIFYLLGDDQEFQLEWVSEYGDPENPSFAFSIEAGPRVMIAGLELPYHCIDISLLCEKGRASVLHGGMTPRIEEVVEHELYPGYFRLQESDPNLLGMRGFGRAMEKALKELIESFEKGCQPKSHMKTARNSQVLIQAVRLKQREMA